MNDDADPAPAVALTLRDFFAGCAAVGMVMRMGSVDAERAYRLADEMMLARDEESNGEGET